MDTGWGLRAPPRQEVQVKHNLGLQGIVRLQQYRSGNKILELERENKITWQGKMDLLNQFFKATSSFTGFYVGLMSTNYGFGLDAPVLATVGSGQFTSYDEATREALTFENADSSSDNNNIIIQNSSSNYAEFNISAGVTTTPIYGIFIANTNVKATTPAKIWCMAAFGNSDASPVAVSVVAADILRVQYTLRVPKA